MSIRTVVILASLLGVAGLGWFLLTAMREDRTANGRGETDVIERTEYKQPQPPQREVLADDRLEDKKPLKFDPAVVDPRPIGASGAWLLNASDAVMRLDVLMLKPDQDAELLTLRASFADAVAAGKRRGQVLPSVNLIDGKAKQFDDGLYAALDLEYYKGLNDRLHGHVRFIRRLYDAVGRNNVAAPYLAAGLQMAGVQVEADAAEKRRLLTVFESNEPQSKPIGFYTWNDELATCFRFLRFFMREFEQDELAVPRALATALSKDEKLLADYRAMVGFFGKLTNPSICLSLVELQGVPAGEAVDLKKLAKAKKVWHSTVAVLPPSTSRETVLFEKLFPTGLPPDADLMRWLVLKSRSGEVDLRPRPDSGWYDHQVYALETLLLAENGEERDKLLLTRTYKKRMLEAFAALMTKRRETHVRQLAVPAAKDGPPLRLHDGEIQPRLRLEPCPTYYLRTARAYAFLADFLEAAVGKDALQKLHGLKQDGQRAANLHAELHQMRELFYGCYLVAAEDIGMKPALAPDEPVDTRRCYDAAIAWLDKAFDDPDLKTDTRVSVPIYLDRGREMTRLWLTLGVRLAKLEASYARPPKIKPAKDGGDWQRAEYGQLGESKYLIPVDEFAEVERKGLRVLTREELRKVCDREKTREAIVAALQK